MDENNQKKIPTESNKVKSLSKKTRRRLNNVIFIALSSVFVTLAMIMSYLETFIPTPHPAIKIGLPNIIIVFILYHYGPTQAAFVSFVRVILTSIIFGTLASSLPYSLTGAVLSLLVMILLKSCKIFSTITVSIVGSILHIVGQVIVACIIMSTAQIAYLIPILAITAVIGGTLVGIAGNLLIKKVPKF